MAMTETEPAPADVPGPAGAAEPERPLWRPIPGNRVVGWVAPLAVAVFGLLLRLNRLHLPVKTAFDEVYYACDAQMLLRYGYEHAHKPNNVCIVDDTVTETAGFVVHPPLGKWLIAMGQWIYGYHPDGGARAAFGWRIAACVIGALSILILCRMGRRLFRSTLLGCFAGVLLALEGLHFTHSRIAMLDIFVLFFVLAAAACLVTDRDWARKRLSERLADDRSYPGPKLGPRPWRIAAAVMIGCALGTKWSAAYYAALFPLVAFAWDVGARRAAGIPRPFRAALRREWLPTLAVFAALPVVVYLLTWTGWFVTDGGWRRSCGTQFPDQCGPVAGFVKYHREILQFHMSLDSPHPYESRPWGWLLLARPVLYEYVTPTKGFSQVVLGIGTPMIWWFSIPALMATFWGWISRRDWRAAFILVAVAVGYVPWFWPTSRTTFLFYVLPIVPFLCLALAYAAGLALGIGRAATEPRRTVATVFVAAYVLLVVLNFFYLYPILSADVVPYEEWRSRMWFQSWI